VFTGRYELSPYIKQARFVFKGLMENIIQYKLLCYDHCNNSTGLSKRIRVNN
jgi:hypothetical protein